jgi:undecaprenyl pyrophosphate synthase
LKLVAVAREEAPKASRQLTKQMKVTIHIRILMILAFKGEWAKERQTDSHSHMMRGEQRER